MLCLTQPPGDTFLLGSVLISRHAAVCKYSLIWGYSIGNARVMPLCCKLQVSIAYGNLLPSGGPYACVPSQQYKKIFIFNIFQDIQVLTDANLTATEPIQEAEQSQSLKTTTHHLDYTATDSFVAEDNVSYKQFVTLVYLQTTVQVYIYYICQIFVRNVD